MIDEIMAAAGIPCRRGRFTGKAPATYAVILDDIDTSSGPDPIAGRQSPQVLRHDVTLELYEDKPDDAAEAALEAAIALAGLDYTKQDRYWIQTEQFYQVIYEFTFFEKRRV